MTDKSPVERVPALSVDDLNTDSVGGEWSPVEPSPEDYGSLQNDVRVIKANVQFLLDRVLVMEQHIENIIVKHRIGEKEKKQT